MICCDGRSSGAKGRRRVGDGDGMTMTAVMMPNDAQYFGLMKRCGCVGERRDDKGSNCTVRRAQGWLSRQDGARETRFGR